jgi:hypothetical protein
LKDKKKDANKKKWGDPLCFQGQVFFFLKP